MDILFHISEWGKTLEISDKIVAHIISIMLLTFLTNMGVLAQNCAFFDDDFPTKRFFDNFTTAKNSERRGCNCPLPLPSSPVMMPLIVVI